MANTKRRAAYTTVGEAIRHHRKKRQRRTLEDLSTRCGIVISHLSEIERGIKRCGPDALEAILHALGLDERERERIIKLAAEEKSKSFRDLLREAV